jgi:hypothetical protein
MAVSVHDDTPSTCGNSYTTSVDATAPTLDSIRCRPGLMR